MKKEKNILILIFGTGYDFYVGGLKPEKTTEFVSLFYQGKNNLDFLFTEDIWKNNLRKKIPLLKKLSDFNLLEYYRGANLYSVGQIEFWVNGKRIKKYKLEEIISLNNLFPLFNFIERDLSTNIYLDKKIIFGYQEKGQLARFSFYTENFNIDLVNFDIINLNINGKQVKIIDQIYYDGILLNSTKQDTLITETIFNLI